MTKIIAFDLNNTVYQIQGVRPDGELAAYGQHLRTCLDNNKWLPLKLPVAWNTLTAHPDAKEGIALLRQKGYKCVSLSNNPLPMQAAQAQHNGIVWDGLTPLEAFRTFKTQPQAYLSVCQIWQCTPADVMMVTANKKFGDLEVSAALGMRPMLIRDEDGQYATILELAEALTYADGTGLAYRDVTLGPRVFPLGVPGPSPFIVPTDDPPAPLYNDKEDE